MTPYLTVQGLQAGYGKLQVLHGVDLDVMQGEVVLVIGHNGAGKSTMPKVVFGLLPSWGGAMSWRDEPITGRTPARNVAAGMGFVQQGRGVFQGLSVLDNLRMGAWVVHDKAEAGMRLDRVLTLFPALRDKRSQRAGALSGGQQRLLSIGIALMAQPELLFIDEPSIGLSPAMVQQVMEHIASINRTLGMTIVLIEQNVRPALAIADRVYVLKLGRVVLETTPAAILERGGFWDLY